MQRCASTLLYDIRCCEMHVSRHALGTTILETPPEMIHVSCLYLRLQWSVEEPIPPDERYMREYPPDR